MRIALWGNTALITAWRNLLLRTCEQSAQVPQSSGFPAVPLRRGACHRTRLRAIRRLLASTAEPLLARFGYFTKRPTQPSEL